MRSRRERRAPVGESIGKRIGPEERSGAGRLILIRDRRLAGEAILLGERRRVAGLIRVRKAVPGPQVAAYPGRARERVRSRDPVSSRPRSTGEP